MLKRIRRLPSPALVIASIALILAVGGGSFALGITDKKSDKKIAKKVATKVANKQITQRVPGMVSGALTPAPFTDLSLEGGWVRNGSSVSNPSFYKDQLGVVHLQGGLFNNTNPPDGSTIGTLPAGARPETTKDFATIGGGLGTTPCAIAVLSTGGIQEFGCGATGAFPAHASLDGITFRTNG